METAAAEESSLVDSQLAEANSEMDLCGASMGMLYKLNRLNLKSQHVLCLLKRLSFNFN